MHALFILFCWTRSLRSHAPLSGLSLSIFDVLWLLLPCRAAATSRHLLLLLLWPSLDSICLINCPHNNQVAPVNGPNPSYDRKGSQELHEAHCQLRFGNVLALRCTGGNSSSPTWQNDIEESANICNWLRDCGYILKIRPNALVILINLHNLLLHVCLAHF